MDPIIAALFGALLGAGVIGLASWRFYSSSPSNSRRRELQLRSATSLKTPPQLSLGEGTRIEDLNLRLLELQHERLDTLTE